MPLLPLTGQMWILGREMVQCISEEPQIVTFYQILKASFKDLGLEKDYVLVLLGLLLSLGKMLDTTICTMIKWVTISSN